MCVVPTKPKMSWTIRIDLDTSTLSKLIVVNDGIRSLRKYHNATFGGSQQAFPESFGQHNLIVHRSQDKGSRRRYFSGSTPYHCLSGGFQGKALLFAVDSQPDS